MEEKEFTQMELLSTLWFMKPFFLCCPASKCLKNAKECEKHVQLVNDKLDFFDIFHNIYNCKEKRERYGK